MVIKCIAIATLETITETRADIRIVVIRLSPPPYAESWAAANRSLGVIPMTSQMRNISFASIRSVL